MQDSLQDAAPEPQREMVRSGWSGTWLALKQVGWCYWPLGSFSPHVARLQEALSAVTGPL